MREYGSQAVVWQTAINPVVALELLAEGAWNGVGVLGPEAFPPQPFLAKLEEYGAPSASSSSIPLLHPEASQATSATDDSERQVTTCNLAPFLACPVTVARRGSRGAVRSGASTRGPGAASYKL